MPRQPEFGAPEHRCSEQHVGELGLRDAARGPRRSAAAGAEQRRDRPAESGSRTSSPSRAEAAGAGVAASGRGSACCKPRASLELAPSTRRAPKPVRQTICPSVSLRANAAAADAGGDAPRPPAGSRAPSHPSLRPPIAPPAPPAAPPASRRWSLGEVRARTGPGSPGWRWDEVCAPPPPSSALRSCWSLHPRPASGQPGAPPTREPCSGVGGEDGGAEGEVRVPGEHAHWEQPGGVTGVDEQRVPLCHRQQQAASGGTRGKGSLWGDSRDPE